MKMKKILVTGGAGFAGSNLAISFKQAYPSTTVVAFDNLKRRGSELILSRLRDNGVEFVHGDVRIKDDLLDVGKIDLILDCAAEPSVMAGRDGSPHYVIDTNLGGTINALELARKHDAKFIFLSTSRVYPVAALNAIDFKEDESRFSIAAKQKLPGISSAGVSEDFPLHGARTLYGASKLSSEHLVTEYIDTYGINGIINRCGILTGPWQMGKVDQGVVVLWAAKHIYKKELSYIGFGGSGKQVRDMLHVRDLFELLTLQLKEIEQINGEVFNVGGGLENSASLAELTELCREATGENIKISRQADTRPGDIRIYITDNSKVSKRFGWTPKVELPKIIEEIALWIRANQVALAPILA